MHADEQNSSSTCEKQLVNPNTVIVLIFVLRLSYIGSSINLQSPLCIVERDAPHYLLKIRLMQCSMVLPSQHIRQIGNAFTRISVTTSWPWNFRYHELFTQQPRTREKLSCHSEGQRLLGMKFFLLKSFFICNQ